MCGRFHILRLRKYLSSKLTTDDNTAVGYLAETSLGCLLMCVKRNRVQENFRAITFTRIRWFFLPYSFLAEIYGWWNGESKMIHKRIYSSNEISSVVDVMTSLKRLELRPSWNFNLRGWGVKIHGWLGEYWGSSAKFY